jgi:hypothetical protein
MERRPRTISGSIVRDPSGDRGDDHHKDSDESLIKRDEVTVAKIATEHRRWQRYARRRRIMSVADPDESTRTMPGVLLSRPVTLSPPNGFRPKKYPRRPYSG